MTKLNRRLPQVDASRFAMVPRSDVPRSTFPTQHTVKTCMDVDYLYPIHIDEVLPGDIHDGTQADFHQLAAFFGQTEISLVGVHEGKKPYEVKYLGAEREEIVPARPPFGEGSRALCLGVSQASAGAPTPGACSESLPPLRPRSSGVGRLEGPPRVSHRSPDLAVPIGREAAQLGNDGRKRPDHLVDLRGGIEAR